MADPHGRPPHAETRRLAAFAAGIAPASLPPEVVARARQVVADSLACGVAGFTLAPEIVEPLQRYLGTLAAPGPATVLGTGQRVQPQVAALANGTTMHTIDFDDTHMASIAHFGASVTAAALAAVERRVGSGAELCAAVVAGFEVGGKVGRAVMPGHYQRWHSTASLGGLAAAGAAARGLGLDEEGVDVAIGLAGDDTGGTRYCIKVGDFTKSLHAGTAAWKGVQGALLAEAGAAGPTGLLEHPVGFCWAYSDERDARRLGPELETLGTRWEILDDDIKAHPCILSSHTAIEGTLVLLERHGLVARDLAAIRLTQPPYSPQHGMNYEPDSPMAARLSVPFCVAIAALEGAVGLAQFEDERFLRPDVRELMRKVTLEQTEELARRYPATTPTIVELETTAGDVFREEVGRPRGAHDRPLSDDEHRDKLEELLSRTLDPVAVAELLDAFARLDRLADVRELTALLA